jgi:hypothetical protein
MRKFSAILAGVLVAALVAAIAGFIHFHRLFPLLNGWIIYRDAVLSAKLSMSLSGLVLIVTVILTAVGVLQRKTGGSGHRLVALALGLGALAFAGLVATMGYTSIQQAMTITGVTDPIVTAPGYMEVMLVLILGLLPATLAAVEGAMLARPSR